MMAMYEGFEDARIKHLEMIQSVISRLGNDEFIVKGWAVTVAGAFYGFALAESEWKLGLASIVTTAAFWGLDTYFLRSERLFRELFELVRRKHESIEPFFMSATSPDCLAIIAKSRPEVASWWRTAWRPTLRVLYGVLLTAAVAVMLIVLTTPDPAAEWVRHAG